MGYGGQLTTFAAYDIGFYRANGLVGDSDAMLKETSRFFGVEERVLETFRSGVDGLTVCNRHRNNKSGGKFPVARTKW